MEVVYSQKQNAEGDLVWLHSPAIPRGQSKKLHCPWTGPYCIVNKLSDCTYRVQNMCNRRQRYVVHFDRLKLCPPEMCLSDTNNCTTTTQRPKQPRSQMRYQPPTGQLEIVDEDDYIPPPQQIPLQPSPPPPSEPRYPRRNRRPPDYYQTVISH